MHTLKIRQRAGIILASLCAALLVSGCGGGVAPIDAQDSPLQQVQYSSNGSSQPAQASSDSFTAKSSKEFNGFNPELWNDRKAWYECDCGRHPQKQQAKVMTWNPI